MSNHDDAPSQGNRVKNLLGAFAPLVTNKVKSLVRFDAIKNTLSGIGTYGDKGTSSRPTTDNWLDDLEIDVLYATNDLARRIVDEVVDDATKGGWAVTDAESGAEVEAPTAHKIEKRVNSAGKKGRLKGIGAIIMVPDDAQADMSRPMSPDEEVANLLVVERNELSEYAYGTDPREDTFGEAVQYLISPDNEGGRVYSPVVHASRMLIFEGDELPERIEALNQGFPASVLQTTWPPIQRFTELEQNIATIIAGFETATYSISGLASVLSDADGEELLSKRVRLIQETISSINAVVLDSDAGEDYRRNYANLNGLDTIWDRFAHSTAKAARMPMTQLFGMSPSGQSTDDESGRANWRKTIRSYQRNVLTPLLSRYYEILNDGRPVKIVYGNLAELTPQQEADVGVKKATARNLYSQAMIGGTPLLVHPDFQKLLKDEGVLNKDFEYSEAPEAAAGAAPGVEEVTPEPNEEGEAAPEGEELSPLQEGESTVSDPSGITNRTDASLKSDKPVPRIIRERSEELEAAWIAAYNESWDDQGEEVAPSQRHAEAAKAAFQATDDARADDKKALEEKAEGLEGIGVATLQEVYDRGVGAYRSNPGSVHKGVSGPEQWALGRVNSFIEIFKGSKSSNLHDLDLLPEDHPKHSKENEDDATQDRYKVPESARNNARQVLKWREEHPDEIEGMTDVGWGRARQLAENEYIGVETVRKMAAFNRHRKNSKVAEEFEDEPWKDAGYVAWLGWGGDTGVDWAREITGAAEE